MQNYAKSDALFAEANAFGVKSRKAIEARNAAEAFVTAKRIKTVLATKAFIEAMCIEAAEARKAAIAAEIAAEAAAKATEAAAKIADARSGRTVTCAFCGTSYEKSTLSVCPYCYHKRTLNNWRKPTND